MAGHTGEDGEVMKIARSHAPAAMHRLAELVELNQLDREGNLVPLSDLPDADRRVIAVAANSILDRALRDACGSPEARAAVFFRTRFGFARCVELGRFRG